MTTRFVQLLRVAAVAGLMGGSPTALEAQRSQTSDLSPIFEALQPWLAASHVFAVDAGSFAGTLGESLGRTISPEEVEASLGPNFQYGRLLLFLSCEAEVPCVLTEDGSHVALAQAAAGEPAEKMDMYLAVNGVEDGALSRRFELLRLQQSEGKWSVVGRVINGTLGPAVF